MELRKAIDLFITEKVSIEVKEVTVGYYKQHLKQVLIFCDMKGYKDIFSLPDDFDLKFIKWQKQKGICNATINKRLEKFRSLLRYFDIYYKWFDKKRMQQKIKTFNIICERDIKKILNYMYKLENNKINLTYKCMIFLLIDTGVRINELLNIEIKNINFDDNMILLTKTKVDIDRYVFFTDYTKNLLLDYVNLKFDRDLLFYNFRVNSNLKRGAVIRFLNKLKKELNIIKLHPHMFRHTFATMLLKNGAPLYSISKLLGHTSVRTTERYLHSDIFMLQEEFKKYYPNFYN